MKSRKLSTPALAGMVAGGLLLYLVLGYFVLAGPKRGHVGDLKAEVARAETELAQLQAAAAAGDADAGEKIRSADVFRLAKAMPGSADMPGILLELADVAQAAGITFESITPEGSTVADGYQVIPVNLVFQGSFYELSDFLFRLRNLVGVRDGALDARGRLFSVEQLDFAESERQFPELRATLIVNAYVYGTDEPALSGGAATKPAESAEDGAATPPGEAPAEGAGTEAGGLG